MCMVTVYAIPDVTGWHYLKHYTLSQVLHLEYPYPDTIKYMYTNVLVQHIMPKAMVNTKQRVLPLLN